MTNMVNKVVAVAFWVIFASQVIEFCCGYYEDDPRSCNVAETHYILRESWYARGCRFGAK